LHQLDQGRCEKKKTIITFASNHFFGFVGVLFEAVIGLVDSVDLLFPPLGDVFFFLLTASIPRFLPKEVADGPGGTYSLLG